jgi:DNA-directed RNA polymerase subunit RPC12/RpoP
MVEAERTGAQRLATPSMEAESRAWMVSCPHCGFERSLWDTGGVRYRAAGTSRNYMRCPSCGKRGWNKICWSGAAPAGPGVPGAAPASADFVIRLVASILVGVLLGTAAIVFVALKLSGAL